MSSTHPVIQFLAAGQPICKSYKLDSKNQLVKTPYPFVYDVTSHEVQVSNLQSFYTHILDHALKGHCLLKGQLARPLVSESRAGSTDRNEKTEWICLDLDGVENYQSVDLFLADIGLADTDYILQWSSSMGLENQTGFRCHIFMLLNEPTHPQILKQWLMHLNLSRPTLSSQLELTKTGNALRWTLDVTTCQNDKLLYIAPPILGKGIKDPYPKTSRFALEKRKHKHAKLPTIPAKSAIQQEADKVINDLRTKSGMAKRRATKFKFKNSTEYMTNPDSAVITGIKTEREFVYFNLNGGDSWAYYHPIDNPEFIFNFKGEPAYRTEDLIPEYWAEVSRRTSEYEPDSKGRIYFAFREFRSGAYFNGVYDTNTKQLELAQAKSETQLRHFMAQHGQPLGEFITDWDLEFNPTSSIVFDKDKRVLNTYKPSTYYIDFDPKFKPKPTPVIDRIVSHVLANDPPTIEHFINWLACIIQFRTHTDTAWILQGTQGTGKGVLFHRIISPMLGEWNVVAKRMEEIESEFTGYVENKFVTFVDEMEKGNSLFHTKVQAKLKNLIVEPKVSIRHMYRPPYEAPNFNNMIFASNRSNEVLDIPPDDRRFSVAPLQSTRLQVTTSELEDDIPKELPSFFHKLMTMPANQDLARSVLKNSARDQMIATSLTSIDTVTHALLSGDLAFFWDLLPSTKNKDQLHSLTPAGRVETKFRDWLVNTVQTNDTKVTRDELFDIFNYCVGSTPSSPNKFTALLRHHNIHMHVVWKNNRSVRGITVNNWNVDTAWLTQANLEIQNGLI